MAAGNLDIRQRLRIPLSVLTQPPFCVCLMSMSRYLLAVNVISVFMRLTKFHDTILFQAMINSFIHMFITAFFRG